MDFGQLIISLLGVLCVRLGGIIVKFLLGVGVCVKESTFSCKYLLISICVKSQ